MYKLESGQKAHQILTVKRLKLFIYEVLQQKKRDKEKEEIKEEYENGRDKEDYENFKNLYKIFYIYIYTYVCINLKSLIKI